MGRGAALWVIGGSLVGAFFGRVWLSWAGETLPAWQPFLDAAGWVVLGAFLLAGALLTWRVLRSGEAPPAGSGPPSKQGWFPVVIIVEVALVIVGRNLLDGQLGHPEWIPVWTMVVVGAHFVPFGLLLGIRGFHVLAGALCAVAVVTAAAALLIGSVTAWYLMPGLGGAASLWGFAGWALARSARGRGLPAASTPA